MITFDDLNISPNILKAIGNLGFEHPMPVQQQVIPRILEQTDDIIVMAQTGTGKTAAFGIPIIQQIQTRINAPQALILSPTRELCIQITADLQSFAVHERGINILAVYGGASYENQLRELKKGVHIIVATPGRLTDLIERKAVPMTNIATVVLDEADEMLNMGFQESIASILEKVPAEHRTLLFSATMPKEVATIARKYMVSPDEIVVGTKNSASANVSHVVYPVNGRDKFKALKRIIDSVPQIYGIIFCRTRRDTQEIASMLVTNGYNADALHGDLSQAQRDAVMNKFRVQNISLLVATDVAARGIDVDNLTHVIHYDLPDDIEAYTHRSGRTGRANKKGISVSLVSSREKNQLSQIERILKISFKTEKIPTGKEISKAQMMHWVGRLDTVAVSHHMLRKMVPGVYDMLEQFDKEELIRRLAGLEFEKLLAEYGNAEDIESPDLEIKIKKASKRQSFEDRSDSGENFTRLFINLGKMDGLFPRELMGLINKSVRGERVTFGKIDLMREFSFFEIESQQVGSLMKNMKNVNFGNRRVEISLAKKDQGDAGRSNGKMHNNGFRKPSRVSA
ncbi:MAG TPA: hypothetical protein DCM62_04715 [Bacteroidales bacterium]|nr:hypothetical protein [Bacteroidales bacterium]